jgi:hypothetical protein
MTIKSLTEELAIIDQTMRELDDRRTRISNQLNFPAVRNHLPSNVLQFPERITVSRSAPNAGGDADDTA